MTLDTDRRAHDAQWGSLCELYVMDALDDAQSQAFVAHAAGCAACAEALVRESRLELRLLDFASRPAASVLRPRFGRARVAAAVALAACVALVVFLSNTAKP